MERVSCSGPTVQTVGNGIEFVLTVDREVGAFGQILAKQSVGVLAGSALPGAMWVVSRPKGFHLKPLAEPYVRLSPHTAPVSQPVPQRYASERTTVGRQPPSCVAIQRDRKSTRLNSSHI